MLQLLLVDDEEYVVDDLEISFPWSSYGIEKVHKAYSGTEALQIVNDHPIDILISDIAMPGMSGLELIRRIREQNRVMKCILLTGYAEFSYAQEAIKQEVSDYLIKPLDRSKLGQCLEIMIQAMKQQLEQTISHENALRTFLEHLPLLKDKLLNELIQGKAYAPALLAGMLDKYALPFKQQDEIFFVLIRLEAHFTRYGRDSLLLFEYAVTNIACELFGDSFASWYCRDSYDYLVFALKPSQPPEAADAQTGTEQILAKLTHLSLQLHHNVNEYLKGGISVILTGSSYFSQGIPLLYQQAVTALRKQIGQEQGYFLALPKQPEAAAVQSLSILYEPPTFLHLLETGQWEGYKERLMRTQQSLESLPEITEEHLDELTSLLLSSFHYIAHKNNSLLSELVGRELIHRPAFRSLSQIIEWAVLLADTLRSKLDRESNCQKQELIQEIQSFVSGDLAAASLQSVAEHVSLHPVYVSKLFKQHSGHSLSEYILRVKMEQAAYMLQHSQDKIYEISEKLGYSNSQYFIRVFKEQNRMTPQEYRVLHHGG
ncbi:response regulator [Paenibacillus donghaensis]|nr:response regulator [Paenibacillus donghaensis]